MLLSELNEPSFDIETVSYCAVAVLLGSNRTRIKQIYIYTEISDSRSFLKSSLQQIGSDFAYSKKLSRVYMYNIFISFIVFKGNELH